MSDILRRRIEHLERRPAGDSLQDLPEEALQQRLDLLLRLFVYADTGRDLSALQGELEALGPLRLSERRSAPPDEDAIRSMALDTLRSEPRREDYRELLEILAAGPVS